MRRFPEPAALDLTGAQWQPGGSYSIVDSAKRYEFYEKNFAAVVCTHMAPSAGQHSSSPRSYFMCLAVRA